MKQYIAENDLQKDPIIDHPNQKEVQTLPVIDPITYITSKEITLDDIKAEAKVIDFANDHPRKSESHNLSYSMK